MKKATILVLVFALAFTYGFVTVHKVQAANCDMSDKQYAGWGVCGDCDPENEMKRWLLECGTDRTTGEPCGCVWRCLVDQTCRPANPHIP